MPQLNERVAKAESILDELKKTYLADKEKTDKRLDEVESTVSDLKNGHQQSSDGIVQILKRLDERKNDWKFWIAICSPGLFTIGVKIFELLEKGAKP